MAAAGFIDSAIVAYRVPTGAGVQQSASACDAVGIEVLTGSGPKALGGPDDARQAVAAHQAPEDAARAT